MAGTGRRLAGLAFGLHDGARLGGGGGRPQDQGEQLRAILHGAQETAAYGHQAGGYGALEVLRGAHVDDAGGNGAGGQAVLHQGDEHRVDDAQIDRPRLAAHDLREHDFGEGFLADQVLDQVGVAVRHALQVVGAQAGDGAVHAISLMTESRTTFLSTLPTDERGRLAKTWRRLGVCTGPSLSRTKAISSCGSALAPPWNCTAACTASPHLSSGMPNTAHS